MKLTFKRKVDHTLQLFRNSTIGDMMAYLINQRQFRSCRLIQKLPMTLDSPFTESVRDMAKPRTPSRGHNTRCLHANVLNVK